MTLDQLQAGYAHEEMIWYAVDAWGQVFYLVGKNDHLTRSEKLLLRMAVRAIPQSDINPQSWEQKISDALCEPLEPYDSAMRIEDEIENFAVPWKWPIYAIGVRPEKRSTLEMIGEVAKGFEWFADSAGMQVHMVTDPALIMGVISFRKTAETKTFSGIEIAHALVDRLMSAAVVNVRSIHSDVIRSFPELLRTAKRMNYIFQTAERFQLPQSVYSIRGIGVFELLFAIKSQLRQAYTNHVLSPSALTVLGSELEQTVLTFIQNNLNMSETARQLYLHRNSLLYRIERIKELTGYDIRVFQDAVTVWTALLLKKN